MKNCPKKHHWFPQFVIRNLSNKNCVNYIHKSSFKTAKIQTEGFVNFGFKNNYYVDSNNVNYEINILSYEDKNLSSFIKNIISKFDKGSLDLSFDDLLWLINYHHSMYLRNVNHLGFMTNEFNEFLKNKHLKEVNDCDFHNFFLKKEQKKLESPSLFVPLWKSDINLYINSFKNTKYIFGDYPTLFFTPNNLSSRIIKPDDPNLCLIIPLNNKYTLEFKANQKKWFAPMLISKLNVKSSYKEVLPFSKYFSEINLYFAKNFVFSERNITNDEKNIFILKFPFKSYSLFSCFCQKDLKKQK